MPAPTPRSTSSQRRAPRNLPEEQTAPMPSKRHELISLYAHGRTPMGAAVGRAVLAALDLINKDQTILTWYDISDALSKRARRELEAEMSDFYPDKPPKGISRDAIESVRRIEAIVRERIEPEIRAEASANAALATTAQAVLRVLRARGIAVTEAEEARITTCQDLPTLESWIVRALQVESTSELFH